VKKKTTRTIIILLTALFLVDLAGTKEEIHFIWRGKITVRQKLLPGPGSMATGEVITEWQLDVNWKETRKNDIKVPDPEEAPGPPSRPVTFITVFPTMTL
jgi:hypothetical protein